MSNLILMDSYFNILQEVGGWKVYYEFGAYWIIKDKKDYRIDSD